MSSVQFNPWHKKKCGTAVIHINDRYRQAPRRDMARQAVRTLTDMRTVLLVPSLLPHGSKSRDGHKIGGFVVKGNPKIHSQYFHFPALRPSVYKFNENFHSAKVRTAFLTSSHIPDA